MKKLFLATLTLSCAFNTPAYSGLSSNLMQLHKEEQTAEQQASEDLILKLVQIEVTYQGYLNAQELGNNTREFTDPLDSHFKGLERQIQLINPSSSDYRTLNNLDMFFKKFEFLNASMGRKREFSDYFRTSSELVRTLKASVSSQLLRSQFEQCYRTAEVPNSAENGSVMLDILNSLSEYKCYINSYQNSDRSAQSSYIDSINEYFGIIKTTSNRNITHQKVKKNRNLISSRRSQVVSHTSRKRIVSQDYNAERDIFSNYVLGNPEELKHLNTKNRLGQDAIELAISLNLDNVGQILREALSDFTQSLENIERNRNLNTSQELSSSSSSSHADLSLFSKSRDSLNSASSRVTGESSQEEHRLETKETPQQFRQVSVNEISNNSGHGSNNLQNQAYSEERQEDIMARKDIMKRYGIGTNPAPAKKTSIFSSIMGGSKERH